MNTVLMFARYLEISLLCTIVQMLSPSGCATYIFECWNLCYLNKINYSHPHILWGLFQAIVFLPLIHIRNAWWILPFQLAILLYGAILVWPLNFAPLGCCRILIFKWILSGVMSLYTSTYHQLAMIHLHIILWFCTIRILHSCDS